MAAKVGRQAASTSPRARRTFTGSHSAGCSRSSGTRPVDKIRTADVVELVEQLHGREVEAGDDPQERHGSCTDARLRRHRHRTRPATSVQVRLPREDAADMEPPTAGARRSGLLAAQGRLHARRPGARRDRRPCRRARGGESGGSRRGTAAPGSIRASVSKTRRPRWVEVPDDLLEVVARPSPGQGGS